MSRRVDTPKGFFEARFPRSRQRGLRRGRRPSLLSPGLFLPLLLCLVLGFAATPAQAKLADLGVRYTHSSQGEPLTSLLSDFAIAQGYSASFTANVVGTVSGEFTDMPPHQFLAGIRAGFGVEAYTLGKTIYFFNQNERQRQVLRVNSMPPSRMRSTLMRMGALSPDLPSSASDQDKFIFFEGPEGYAASLVASIKSLEDSQQSDMSIRVFKLKHAWADDTTIDGASNSTLIPGVASVLRAIVTGRQPPPTRVISRGGNDGKLRGSGLAGREQADATLAQQKIDPSANIIAEPRSNSVVVTDFTHRMPYYEAVIAELDKPVDLVEIHAAIVDINANYERDLGINWGVNVSGNSNWAGTSGDIGSPLGALGAAADSAINMTTIYRDGAVQFLNRIRALEEQGEAATLARPSVLTMDNVQASLEYTTTFYVKLQGERDVDLVDVTAGTTLKVTPRIQRSADGSPSRLAMAVTITDGNDPVTTNKDTWVNDIPPVKKVTINTQAVVSEGQSLLVGGFYYENRNDNSSGVPGVKNIPAAGALFGRNKEGVARRERLILISPRIISYDTLNVAVPERVSNRGFAIDPAQSDYQMTQEIYDVKPKGGCSSSVTRPTPAPRPQRQPDAAARQAPPPSPQQSSPPPAAMPEPAGFGKAR